MQNTFRYLAAKKIKQIGESISHNTVHERYQYNINQIKKTLQQNNLTIARADMLTCQNKELSTQQSSG